MAACIQKIISGGQTGADRAALDVALWFEFPHGGWCSAERKAEDGIIGGQYRLASTPSKGYLQRTAWNVRDSDGTLVITLHSELGGGSARSIRYAQQFGKPCLHVQPWMSYQPGDDVLEFVKRHDIRTLNIAGSLESKDPGIYRWTKHFLIDTFFWSEAHPGTLK